MNQDQTNAETLFNDQDFFKLIASLSGLGEQTPTKKEVFRLLGGRKQKLIKFLAIALTAGVIKKTGTGKKGDPYRYRLQKI